MSQHIPHRLLNPSSSSASSSYSSSTCVLPSSNPLPPTPPPSNPFPYPLPTDSYTNPHISNGNNHQPDYHSYGPFSPSQLTALLDEKIRQLGSGAEGLEVESDMNLTGIDFVSKNRTYRITPIQQPQRSAAFEGAKTHNYVERLPLSPALILQLDCWDAQGDLVIPHDELPFLIVHLTLETPDGSDATMVQSPTSDVVAMVYGTLVTTPAEMVNSDGAAGVYFCFPDVSVRYQGQFRLKANLMRITGGQPLAEAWTDVFDIVAQSEYVAPETTDLTRHFDAQGVVRFGLPRREW